MILANSKFVIILSRFNAFNKTHSNSKYYYVEVVIGLLFDSSKYVFRGFKALKTSKFSFQQPSMVTARKKNSRHFKNRLPLKNSGYGYSHGSFNLSNTSQIYSSPNLMTATGLNIELPSQQVLRSSYHHHP